MGVADITAVAGIIKLRKEKMKTLLVLLSLICGGTLSAGVSAGVDGVGVDVNVGGPYPYYDDGYYNNWYGPGWYYGNYYYDYPAYYSWRSRYAGGPYYWRSYHRHRYWQ